MPDHPSAPDPRQGAATEPETILGVPVDATTAQIDAAYRRALRRHHPDTRPASQHTDPDQPEPTVAELQAARRQMHRRAAHRTAHATSRRLNGLADSTDITAGPVRYHGPPRSGHSTG